MRKANPIIFSLLMICLSSCQKTNPTDESLGKQENTTVGNPVVSVSLASTSTQAVASSFKNSLTAKALALKNFVSPLDLGMCMKVIRFKTTTDDSELGTELELSVGFVRYNGAEAHLTRLQVPAGTYQRVELVFDNVCVENAYSVSVQNTSGFFSANRRLRVRFDGTIKITSDTHLALQFG